jgi:hypothetical protein
VQIENATPQIIFQQIYIDEMPSSIDRARIELDTRSAVKQSGDDENYPQDNRRWKLSVHIFLEHLYLFSGSLKS